MIKRNILKNVAKPVGNYPHSIEVGEFLFISGIGPRQCDDNSIPGNEYDSSGSLKKYDIEKQCHAVFKNIKNILSESNLTFDNLIDITVFLTDMKKDFDIFNNIYSNYFPDGQACRTTVEVNALPTDIAIELKCIARLSKDV
tara:strand:- start:467 stop:892 length:426 start_codon:yes stop_codon:yes gene_type:complete